MNLLENIEDFDEESQKLLRGYAARGSIIQFSEMEKGIYGKGRDPFEGIRINGDDPDYRSGFHDFANTPLGYSYLTDNPVSVFPSTGVNKKGEKGIEYYAEVLPCKNGSEVYRSYEGNARKNQALFLFYEKPDATKSNFSGPFYIAKMGDYFKDLFKMFPKPLPSKINGKPFKDITSMEDEAAYLAQLAYTYEKDKIDATAVYQALMREFKVRTGVTQFDEVLGSISEIPANAIGWCADKLENLKPTEKNYNPESKEYTPIIPVLGAPVPVNMNKAAQFFENLGDNPFVQGAEAAFAKVWAIVEQTAGRVKEVSTDHLPDAFKKLVNKITAIIDNIKILLTDAKDDLAEMAKQGIEMLKLANAFYCGVVSGLVSLVQCLLYILEFLLQPTHTFSYEQYLKRRDLQEKAEDVLDWIAENGPKFLQGIKDLFKGSSHLSASDMESVLDKMKSYFGNVSRYTVAFYTGVLSFEVLINILLLIFTEGAGNIVKGETYVAKLWSLVKVLTKETASVATAGITDLLAFLSKFIVRFGKACAKGFRGFIKFIEELLQGAKNGAKAEDLADDVQDIEEVILKGSKKKTPNDFNEREILEYLKRYNFHGHYRLIDLKKIWLRSIVLKLSIKELTDFVKTGSLLKMERKYLTEEMNFFAKQVKNKFAQQTSKLINGKNCLRDFDINNCGGEIINLDWEHIEIFDEGLDMVKAHLERFEKSLANEAMIRRLEKIIDGEIPITDFDKRFYTHEIREYRRYKNLGVEDGIDDYDV